MRRGDKWDAEGKKETLPRYPLKGGGGKNQRRSQAGKKGEKIV